MKIVTFGTSLTHRGGWQASLECLLAARVGPSVSVVSIARSGATSAWALEHAGDVIEQQPDIVLFEFYANDASLQRFTGLGRSRARVAEILDSFRQDLPQCRVILLGMNPFHGHRAWARPLVQRYKRAHFAEAALRSYETLDLEAHWMALGRAERLRAIPDGAHPRPDVAARLITPVLAAGILAGTLHA